MQLEIGQIYEGIVRNIVKYGAFVEITLPAGEDAAKPVAITGMVHISEISATYVQDIHDVLHENDTVRVKVLSQNEQGKYSFSIKQAAAPAPNGGKAQKSSKPRTYEPKRSVPQSEMSFEDKLLHFMQQSEEKRCDLKRGTERRNHSRRSRS